MQSPDRIPSIFEVTSLNEWGSYGYVLIVGEVYEEDKDLYRDDDEPDPFPMIAHGTPVINRTGPFVPPIALAGFGGCSVTDEFRRKLESSGLRGLVFRPLHKRKIVEVHWEGCDRNEGLSDFDLPRLFDGELMNCLFEGVHSPQIAAAMPDLFELISPRVVGIEFDVPPGDAPEQEYGDEYISCSTSPIRDFDFMRGVRTDSLYVTARAKAWLEEHARDWLVFRAVPVAP